eukprot:CAMPEP_0202485748 /NCGR_PEP_ID=MMETSP1361-20130828/4506_1 /ASSEMBLY_ACC=CAM_ASM_000849 /TAXON_ID=210615 /ORGANISM="Staurosira complex sp., Strain CCMP2646" /LENGTH=228 /DNA_ID=CAMNT_0049114719 /DNA_START=62 /DNA_END=748 /DNA_ORIENTATION=+
MAGEELNAKKMKVSELRDALKERGLSTEGLKGDLVNRLEAYLEEQEFALPGEGSDLSPIPTGAAKPAVEDPVVPAPVLEETKEAVKEKAELEKETATAGTEPSPAPVGPPEPTKAAATTKTSEKQKSEMTFEEKRAARAARFGIPMVETKKTTPKKRPQNEKKGSANKKPKKGPQKKNEEKEKPLLPVEEIEKRLKRAEKFGTGDNAQIQELKAMLRKHRFANKGGGT